MHRHPNFSLEAGSSNCDEGDVERINLSSNTEEDGRSSSQLRNEVEQSLFNNKDLLDEDEGVEAG